MPADVLTESCGSRLSREIQNFSVVMADHDPESSRSLSEAGSGSGSPPSIILPQQMDSCSVESGTAAKKSSNMTERVRVPSSEHVAEIVGRQGCKIKALRAKTNTYIKTPARGEEPVFVVTGRLEDVAEVKREILSAAEHFSQIRASRRNATSGESPRCPAVGTAEQVREKVPVPFWVVGLVVGPKGTTIRRIQQDTQTYIITPGKEKEPVFEILGTTENVNRARQEIESYIALRMRPRHNHAGLGGSWTKLDGHIDNTPLQQPGNLRSSFQVKSSSCLSDAKLKESLDGRYPPTWRQLPGCTGRPLSVDVAEFIRRVPTEESFPSVEMNRFFHENIDVPQKSFLGIEALISNCLSDLNLSDNVLQSFFHHETASDLRPSPAPRCGSKMPFALRPLQADGMDFRDELNMPFDALESDPMP